MTVAYPIPFSTGNGTIFFELNTTGLVLGGNNSHGDAAFSKQVVTILAGAATAQARGPPRPAYNVANGQQLGTGNPQSTKVVGVGQYIPVTVADGSGVSFQCPKAVCKAKQFGQWSAVGVNGGRPVPDRVPGPDRHRQVGGPEQPEPVQAARLPRARQRHGRGDQPGLRRQPAGAGEPECRTSALRRRRQPRSSRSTRTRTAATRAPSSAALASPANTDRGPPGPRSSFCPALGWCVRSTHVGRRP